MIQSVIQGPSTTGTAQMDVSMTLDHIICLSVSENGGQARFVGYFTFHLLDSIYTIGKVV